jgi:hypothetical protein
VISDLYKACSMRRFIHNQQINEAGIHFEENIKKHEDHTDIDQEDNGEANDN